MPPPAPPTTHDVHGPATTPSPDAPIASPEDIARTHARTLYDQGQQAYNAGDYLGAVDAYESSYQVAHDSNLDSAPPVLLAIASANEALHHNPEAIAALRQYITDTPHGTDHDHIQDRISTLSSSSTTSPASTSTSSSSSSTSTPRSSSVSSPSSSSSSNDDDIPPIGVEDPDEWYREVTTNGQTSRYVVHPDDATHLAPDLARYLASAGAHYDADRVRVFQTAAGIRPDGQYGGTTRSALIYWGVSSPPRATSNATGAYTSPRREDGTTRPPSTSASVGAYSASRPDRARARKLASATNRALIRQSTGWRRTLDDFQRAAGLFVGPYDGRTYNALVHYGIRNPAPESAAPAHTTIEAIYSPPRSST